MTRTPDYHTSLKAEHVDHTEELTHLDGFHATSGATHKKTNEVIRYQSDSSESFDDLPLWSNK